MARSKGTHFVITANTTDDGSAVYLREDRTWAPKLVEAWAFQDEAQCEELLTLARSQERQVCDPYAFKVNIGPQGPIATTTRERIRGAGPTTPLRRPDPPEASSLNA